MAWIPAIRNDHDSRFANPIKPPAPGKSAPHAGGRYRSNRRRPTAAAATRALADIARQARADRRRRDRCIRRARRGCASRRWRAGRECARASCPSLPAVLEVAGMGAVDHVVDRVVGGRLIGDLDGALQAVARGQAPVGLQRERDRHRHGASSRGSGDADGLFHVVERECGNHIGIGQCESFDLRGVVVLRLARALSDRAPRRNRACDAGRPYQSDRLA